MNDLIETIARAMCDQHIREVRRWDTQPERLAEMLPQCVDLHWEEHVPVAQAALRALHDAGYAIVPREPTKAMLEAAYAALEAMDLSAKDACTVTTAHRAAITTGDTANG